MYQIKGNMLVLDDRAGQRLVSALHDPSGATTLSHSFYRYPAMLSPWLAGSIIETFSSPGDLVFDPFVGGGTTAVEARARGRDSVGNDISNLAAFVTTAKTRIYKDVELKQFLNWAEGASQAAMPPTWPWQRCAGSTGGFSASATSCQ